MALRTELLSEEHNRKEFDCGEPNLNKFLTVMAKQQNSRHIARTFVLINDAISTHILGFYTLVIAHVKVPHQIKGYKNYPHPLPAIKLARLAVNKHEQKKGYGRHLLIDALKKSLEISVNVGLIGIFVDAKDERVRNFYTPYGFLSTGENNLFLWLPIGTCRQLFDEDVLRV